MKTIGLVGFIGAIAACASNQPVPVGTAEPNAGPAAPGDPMAPGGPSNDALALRFKETGIKRTEIQRAASSIPGRDIVQVRTEIPEGVASGWHTHPGEEVGYIVAGTLDMEIKGRPTLRLQSGQGFLIPPRVPHNAHDLGPGTGIMLSTYLVQHGLPVASLVAED